MVKNLIWLNDFTHFHALFIYWKPKKCKPKQNRIKETFNGQGCDLMQKDSAWTALVHKRNKTMADCEVKKKEEKNWLTDPG